MSVADGIDLFAGLPANVKQAIETKLSRRQFKADEKIIEEANEDSNVFFVISGSVRIGQYTENGHELIFRLCGQGDMFGEFAALNNTPRSADVYAQENSELAYMSAKDFRTILRDYSEISIRLNQRLSRMILNLSERIKQRSSSHSHARVYAYIAREMEKNSQNKTQPLFIALPKQAILAALLDISRETVARALGYLIHENIIQKTSGGIELLDKVGFYKILNADLETQEK